MITFSQFAEAEDATKHGYSFHFFPNKPKGHHTIVATHPHSKFEDSIDADMWADTKGISKKLKHPAVGLAVINHKRNDAYTLYVHPKHHRKGIATGLYNAYEHHTGNKIIPSNTLTPDAENFWKSRQ